MKLETALKSLNHKDRQTRLESVRRISRGIKNDELLPVNRRNECNNHVHSQYSFSPYSPSMIAWKAYRSGLSTCGIIDHESVAGCGEFREACRLLGIVPTIGFEIRLNWNHTILKDRMFNNPDQKSVGYFPIHGVPFSRLPEIEKFLYPIRQERFRRNQKMVKNIDSILHNYGLELDMDWDVIPVSKWLEGGNITERHLLYATAKKLLQKYRPGQEMISFLKNRLGIQMSETSESYLTQTENPFYDFDVTNILKGFFSEYMYVNASETETPDVEKAIPYLKKIGCIPTYTYLGDVKTESVTGDKKPQKFEDDILDEMLALLRSYGMGALSYAPRRNDSHQINMVRKLCKKYDMMEVAGEDINQPRQPFVNLHLDNEIKKYFDLTTWAIIGHEKMADVSLDDGFFSKKTIKKYPELSERLKVYEKFGKTAVRE
ncbi:MAG TPA: PHP domain-containing protein [Candidatus Blautia faecipullorum]|nr:PHP domain-containing protein [Candidatus Blautia faecipullorum]